MSRVAFAATLSRPCGNGICGYPARRRNSAFGRAAARRGAGILGIEEIQTRDTCSKPHERQHTRDHPLQRSLGAGWLGRLPALAERRSGMLASVYSNDRRGGPGVSDGKTEMLTVSLTLPRGGGRRQARTARRREVPAMPVPVPLQPG